MDDETRFLLSDHALEQAQVKLSHLDTLEIDVSGSAASKAHHILGDYVPLLARVNCREIAVYSSGSRVCGLWSGDYHTPQPGLDASVVALALHGQARLERLRLPLVNFAGDEFEGFLTGIQRCPIKSLWLDWPAGLDRVKIVRPIATLSQTLEMAGLTLAAPQGFAEGVMEWPRDDMSSERLFQTDNPGVTVEVVDEYLVKLGMSDLRGRLRLVMGDIRLRPGNNAGKPVEWE